MPIGSATNLRKTDKRIRFGAIRRATTSEARVVDSAKDNVPTCRPALWRGGHSDAHFPLRFARKLKVHPERVSPMIDTAWAWPAVGGFMAELPRLPFLNGTARLVTSAASRGSLG